MILQGIPKTQCMLDEITIAGEDVSGLLEQVLQYLRENNLTRKCRQKLNSVDVG